MSEDPHRRLNPKEIEQIAHDEAVGRVTRPGFNESEDHAREEYRAAMQENGPYLTLGMQMALTIGLGAGVGWWIDSSTGSSVWLGVGAGLGAVLGMTYFILVVIRMEAKRKKSGRDIF